MKHLTIILLTTATMAHQSRCALRPKFNSYEARVIFNKALHDYEITSCEVLRKVYEYRKAHGIDSVLIDHKLKSAWTSWSKYKSEVKR